MDVLVQVNVSLPSLLVIPAVGARLTVTILVAVSFVLEQAPVPVITYLIVSSPLAAETPVTKPD